MQNGDEASTSISPTGRGQFVKFFSYFQHHDDKVEAMLLVNSAWMKTQNFTRIVLFAISMLPSERLLNKQTEQYRGPSCQEPLCRDSAPA